MNTVLTSVFAEKNTPHFLLFCQNKVIRNLLLEAISDVSVVYIGDKTDTLAHKSYIQHFIPFSSLELFEKVKDKLHYCFIYLEKEKDKDTLLLMKDKLERDRTTTIIALHIRNIERFYDVIAASKDKAHITILLIGDLFGYAVPSDFSPAAHFVSDTLTKKMLTLRGNDLSPLLPLSSDDFISSVHSILFGVKKKERLFFLFYEHPQTVLSSIHTLRRVEPELSLDYVEENTGREHTKSAEYYAQEIYSKVGLQTLYFIYGLKGFEKSIHDLIESHTLHESPEELLTKSRRARIKVDMPSPRSLKPLFTVLSLSIIFFLLFHGIIYLLLYITYQQAYGSAKNLDRNGISRARTSISSLYKLAKPSLITAAFVEQNVLHSSRIEEKRSALEGQIDILNSFSDVLAQGSRSFQSNEELQSLIAQGYNLYFLLEKARVTNPDINTHVSSILPPSYSSYISTIQLLPQLLGFESKKNYLILFQNNGELRPSGGFIGSLAQVSFEKGILGKYQIRDVYEGDGQLKEHIEPHFIIRRNLQPHLYLRDSNFDPDFEKSASAASQLYTLETKTDIDGVIGIDFSVLKRIMRIIGPIKLYDYNKIVNENTLFEFMQTTINSNFFAGSTQKKDLLVAIASQIQLKLQNNPQKTAEILKLLPQLIEEKHILFSFTDPSVEALFRVNGFSGSFADLRESKSDIVNDLLSVNEANIGVNKANIDVTRDIKYTLEVTGKNLVSTALITIHNKGNLDYKPYLRLATPLGSHLESVTIDSQKQSLVNAVTDYRVYEDKKFKAPSGLEVDTTSTENYQTFGFITTIPKHTDQVIKITYRNGLLLPSTQSMLYSLRIIKQPGVDTIPFNFEIILPAEYTLKNDSQTLSSNKATFVLSKDTVIQLAARR